MYIENLLLIDALKTVPATSDEKLMYDIKCAKNNQREQNQGILIRRMEY